MTSVSNSDHRNLDGLRPLALLATGSTGADIERLVREARGQARRQRRKLCWADVEKALKAFMRPIDDTLDWQIAVHEIGHAIVYTVLGIGTISTVRIGGPGGVVSVEVSVATVQDETGLGKLIAAILAGRAAEKLVLERVGIGAGGSIVERSGNHFRFRPKTGIWASFRWCDGRYFSTPAITCRSST